VVPCDDEEAAAATLASLAERRGSPRRSDRPELVPPLGHDLRIVVSGGGSQARRAPRRAGGVAHERCAGRGEAGHAAAAGGGRARPRAVAAVGADLAGVDLLPLPDGGWTVLEVNGAVDFTLQYRRDRTSSRSAVEGLLDPLWPRSEPVTTFTTSYPIAPKRLPTPFRSAVPSGPSI
jgi:hypothetical protein